MLDRTAKRQVDIMSDGLNSLRYKLIDITEQHLYTLIRVDAEMQNYEVNTTSIKQGNLPNTLKKTTES